MTSKAIDGAIVTVTAGGVQRQMTTGASGSAEFADLPSGPATVSVSAAGFDSVTYPFTPPLGIRTVRNHFLTATRAWCVGRAIVLGTRMVERASGRATAVR